jgi:hypothetical protein
MEELEQRVRHWKFERVEGDPAHLYAHHDGKLYTVLKSFDVNALDDVKALFDAAPALIARIAELEARAKALEAVAEAAKAEREARKIYTASLRCISPHDNSYIETGRNLDAAQAALNAALAALNGGAA